MILCNRAIHIINNFSALLPLTVRNIKLMNLKKTFNLFVKNNPEIIFIWADKRNVTVTLERNERNITKIKNMRICYKIRKLTH